MPVFFRLSAEIILLFALYTKEQNTTPRQITACEKIFGGGMHFLRNLQLLHYIPKRSHEKRRDYRKYQVKYLVSKHTPYILSPVCGSTVVVAFLDIRIVREIKTRL